MKTILINKKTRFNIYRQALKSLDNPSLLEGHCRYNADSLTGFCKLFTDVAHILGYIHTPNIQYCNEDLYYSIKNYPEVIKYKPSNADLFWFPSMDTSQKGIEIRKEILKTILYENKEIKDKITS